MLNYLLRRLITLPLVLFILVSLSFWLVRLSPGDPFSEEKSLTPQIRSNLEAKYGLDKPLLVQYFVYMFNVMRFDLGVSIKQQGRTVNEIIFEHLPYSVELGLVAFALALILGLTAGIIASIKQNSSFDYVSMGIAMFGLSTPPFVVGPLLVLVFALFLGWFEVSGWGSLKHVVLPSITLALPFAARIARLTRAGMLEVIHQDYITTARAKGLKEHVIVVRHALKGSLLPVVSYLGPGLAMILTGSLVVEKIFGIPGIGREFVESALNRDYPLVLGLVIMFGTVLVLLNLIVDIIYGFLDPRIRYE